MWRSFTFLRALFLESPNLDDGRFFFVRRRREPDKRRREKDEPKEKDAESLVERQLDARILPPAYSSDGTRHWEFSEFIWLPRLTEVDDWALNGPFTVSWLMQHMFRNGETPTSFHSRWPAEVRLDYAATEVSEHWAWRKLFDLASSYDQLNLSALACMELGSSRIQVIHKP